MSPWRFKSAHSSCATEESGINYTSHHLRCIRVDSESRYGSLHRQSKLSQVKSSNSWPGTTTHQDGGLNSYSKIRSTLPELRLPCKSEYRRGQESSQCPSPSALSKPRLQAIRRPPQCRLPMSMRFTTLILYISITLLFLSSTTIAAPAHAYRPNPHRIHHRQAIPDKTGQTGNSPAPVRSTLPSQLATPCTLPPKPTITYNPPSSPKPTTLVPGNAGTTTPPGELGLNPNNPSRPLTLTSPIFPLSAGAIAGIAGGSAVLVCILVSLAICTYRRRRVAVDEIPIRRSKLVSRLGFRVFGEGKPASRSPSRRGSNDSNDSKQSWLDKGTIGRPKPAWLENGLLSVPKPGFLRQERVEEGEGDERAPWVDKRVIGKPTPGRPRSAEPLGRLSGMGLGMGYLK
ncbi:hypothetical protein K505DRAFT_337049 [Melanomma pulvis-pyrius CBS 109.77]|uniref:Uncharacterized protein n=1 Tax=Melanomma pulvis-pyrius CBS 109.77 TaxID=1314802 RepID=A0A6A6XDH7_9PLEO|nr:hypothetical protein K505DRAFT_337049 [Melanomma pulvis-pyrius CBS 109.77]